MKRIFIALAALATIAQAEPITLKGLAPGMTKAQIEEAHPGFTSKCMQTERDAATTEVCGSRGASRADLPALVTFAGVRAISYAALLKGEVAHTVMVVIDQADFEKAESAVTERYGKPASRKLSTVKNRMGAAFDQVDVTWRVAGSVLAGQKRGINVDQASFVLTLERGIEERAGQRKESAKAGAKDM